MSEYDFTTAFEQDEEFSYNILWELIQQGLSANYYMSLQDYRDQCRAGKLEMSTFYGDERNFTRNNPQNPMALENRTPRINAASAFWKFVTLSKGKLYFTEKSPISIYPHLFDCCHSVRHFLIMAFIELNDERAMAYFEKLIPLEDSSGNLELMTKALKHKEKPKTSPDHG